MNDKKFFNIPLLMLKELYTNSTKFFDDAFDVGVYLYSKTLEGSEGKRYRDAKKFFNVTQGGSPITAINNAKRILNSMPAKYPMTGIEKNIYFDYYKNDKSEFEKICLGGFLGIKSILGKKPLCKTNKSMIHVRMFGYSSMNDLPSKLTPLQAKYQIRWHMDKLLLELQENWFLKAFSDHQRGMYISFDLSLDELALKSEESKQRAKKQKFKEAKRDAIEKAKLHINYTLTTA